MVINHRGIRTDGHAGVLEHYGPFRRVVHALAGVGRDVGVPSGGHRPGEVNHRLGGDVDHAVGTVGSGHDDVADRPGKQSRCEENRYVLFTFCHKWTP